MTRRGSYRTFVTFDNYELALLRKLKKELTIAAKRRGEKGPAMADVIRGAVRTGIHTVYGADYVYKEMLTEEEFQRLVGDQIDPSQLEEDDET